MSLTGPQSISKIKSTLLSPATTSHFVVSIQKPNELNSDKETLAETGTGSIARDFASYLAQQGITRDINSIEYLNLACSDASLPGSSFATSEITGDYHGITERHAYRRIYDDRIDLTFYVDAKKYYAIRFFEAWMRYIMSETYTGNADQQGRSDDEKNLFYRSRYPSQYTTNLEITKFEKDNISNNKPSLKYRLYNTYPVSIASMPVSYDASSLLKCTVSMNYSRYSLIPTNSSFGTFGGNAKSANENPNSPEGTGDNSNQSEFRTVPNNIDFGRTIPADRISATNAFNASLPAYDFNQSLNTTPLNITNIRTFDLNKDFYTGGYGNPEDGPPERQSIQSQIGELQEMAERSQQRQAANSRGGASAG